MAGRKCNWRFSWRYIHPRLVPGKMGIVVQGNTMRNDYWIRSESVLCVGRRERGKNNEEKWLRRNLDGIILCDSGIVAVAAWSILPVYANVQKNSHMTRTEALVKTIAMWRWLRDHPHAEKEMYLRKEDNIDNIPKNKCYLCELWHPCQGKNCPLDLTAGPCELFDNHPYTLWVTREDNDCRSDAADAIILLCEQALEEVLAETKKEKRC